ncbi:MAG: hypothetical protein E7425_01775, partial [Ruminococcaceae bacterium]|nr:hypothetical protein [Oscillospiraceae bacterium]
MKNKYSFSFTDDDLALAAAAVRDAMLAELPDGSEHVFSDGFDGRLRAAVKKDKLREAFGRAARVAAAVLLALIVGGAAYLASSPDARASLKNWTRELYED